MSELAWVARVLLVVGVLGAALFYLRRTQAVSQSRRGATVQLLGSVRLSKSASVAVVRVGTARYALGVTDKSVTLLSDAVELEDDAGEGSSPVRVNSTLQSGSGPADAEVAARPGGAADTAGTADAATGTPPATSGAHGFRAELVRQLERQIAHRRPGARSAAGPQARPAAGPATQTDLVTDGSVTAAGPAGDTPPRTDAPASPEEQPCPVPRPRSLTAAAPVPATAPAPATGARAAAAEAGAPAGSEPADVTGGAVEAEAERSA